MTYAEKVNYLLEKHECTIYALSHKLGIAKSTLNALSKGISADIRSARNKAIIDDAVLSVNVRSIEIENNK